MNLGRNAIVERQTNSRISLRDVIISWDFAVAVVSALTVWWFFPPLVQGELVKDIYNAGIASLSIIFSVFFAALAIIISASDDQFVRFLNQEGDYDGIVNTFKFTLVMLFLALVASIGLYISSAACLVVSKEYLQPRFLFVGYVGLASYALGAVFLATLDAVRYAQKRGRYLALVEAKKE